MGGAGVAWFPPSSKRTGTPGIYRGQARDASAQAPAGAGRLCRGATAPGGAARGGVDPLGRLPQGGCVRERGRKRGTAVPSHGGHRRQAPVTWRNGTLWLCSAWDRCACRATQSARVHATVSSRRRSTGEDFRLKAGFRRVPAGMRQPCHVVMPHRRRESGRLGWCHSATNLALPIAGWSDSLQEDAAPGGLAPMAPKGPIHHSPGQRPGESAGGSHEPRRGSSTAMAARVPGHRRGAIP